MGMFTTIIDQKTNRQYQIHSGWDDCETYSVGEKVNQWINPNHPNSGKLLDDVYYGHCTFKDTDGAYFGNAYVIIKDSIVVAIEPLIDDDDTDYHEIYQIKPLPRETWSEEVWKTYEDRQEELRKESEEFQASIAHLSPREQLISWAVRPLKQMISYQSYARKLFSIEPLDIKDKL